MKRLLFLLVWLFPLLVNGQQQTINVGTSANDHTGDPLRDAFVKVNHNFTELYSGAGSSNYTGTSPTTTTVGGLPAGSDISSHSISSILQSILCPYINPTFSSFSINVSPTVEVGTGISLSKTATWNIVLGSGTVALCDLLDVTAGTTLLTNTPNDGTQSFTATTITLNTNGATQTWRMVGHNTTPAGDFNSSNYVVTSRFYRFWDAVSASPTNSVTIRAYSNSAFHSGASTFTLVTGTSLTKFVVALPPGVTIASVFDQTVNSFVTGDYALTGTVNVVDAGGTNRAYNIYEMNIVTPYSSSHNHVVTTTN